MNSTYGRRRPNYIRRDGDTYENDGLLGYRKVKENGELEKKSYNSNLEPYKNNYANGEYGDDDD